jgi:hypothetical protein
MLKCPDMGHMHSTCIGTRGYCQGCGDLMVTGQRHCVMRLYCISTDQR